MDHTKGEQIAIHVSIVTIIGNIILTVFKLFAGIVGHSAAMISDAIHSASDVLSSLVVIVGIKLANKKSDADHQYGHERLECVAAIILSIMLALTGAGIGFNGIQKIIEGNYQHLAVPSLLALVAAIISIFAKEAMYWYTRNAGKKLNSGALMADAWHHRSDALSSIGSFAGILGARMGFPILDSVASVIICIFILKVSYDIFLDSINKMTDKACDDKTVTQIRHLILEQPGVMNIDLLKTRLFGERIYIDVEIAANGLISLQESHDIAKNVHDIIEENFPRVKHCMVHVNPYKPKKTNHFQI